MYKIETKHHIIQANYNDKPAFICKGPCECVWWKEDIWDYRPLEILHCKKCGGLLREVKPDDYKILEFAISPQKLEKEARNSLQHLVKPEFAEFARKTWC
ncbi:MAG: hypothetical protein LRY40_09190 [Shewanella fodinae]|nr:hypothetical protein [Shewanella fodinae]